MLHLKNHSESSLTPSNCITETGKSYDATASIYASRYLEDPSEPYYRDFLANIPLNGTILDLGCGHGRCSRLFSERNRKVTGVDISKNMIQLAKESAPK